MRKTTSEKITNVKEQIEQLQKQEKLLLQKQKKEERTARTHRLCKRGGLMEKLLPDLIRLTEAQFETFVDEVLLTNHTTRVLAKLAPPLPPESVDAAQDGNKAATTPTEAAAPTDSAPPPKPAVTAHNGGTGGNVNKGNGAGKAS